MHFDLVDYAIYAWPKRNIYQLKVFETYIFQSIKNIVRTTVWNSVSICEFIWPGADGLIRIYTFPHLVIIYCKETAQTRIRRVIQSSSTKTHMTSFLLAYSYSIQDY
jgi:hypothetical protein